MSNKDRAWMQVFATAVGMLVRSQNNLCSASNIIDECNLDINDFYECGMTSFEKKAFDKIKEWRE